MKRSLSFWLLGTLLGGFLLAALRWLSPLPPPPSPALPAPTLLVLGASQVAGLPSPAFRRRLDEAFRLYQQGGVMRIIVSGGVGEGDLFSEGEIGVRYLRAQGVPVGILRAEEQSRTTYQNLRNSRPLIAGRVTLVTDSVHARRALSLALAEGLSADVSSVSFKAAPRYLLRETAALLMWRLFGYTGGRPAPRAHPGA
ncbi:YdcF family protein [Deinococcus psychrotolerans]|uniref:YdcF family protein n=1 Tax=Deinococcus psychrotolerans TaxID=2489213 RepID=A0A3G8YDU5_9DEIO|nr:YdcF family protein [Deinococcus psychrotolerans]AZI42397.1 YdcF family protein [Deinococcus psychrotolerans]